MHRPSLSYRSIESSRQRRTNREELDMNRTGATLPHPNASAGIDRVGERAPRERRRERRFEFGRELEADGRWVRQESAFRRWVTADGSSGLPAVAGRYHLYVSLCDPWSHRTVIVRRLLGSRTRSESRTSTRTATIVVGRSPAATSPTTRTASRSSPRRTRQPGRAMTRASPFRCSGTKTRAAS